MVTKTLTAAGPEKDNKIIEKIVADQDNSSNSSPLCSRQVEWEEASKLYIFYTISERTQ